MLIKNGKVFNNKGFEDRDIFVHQGIITDTTKNFDTNSGCEVVDASECYVVPGFIDIHSHGVAGFDFMFAAGENLDKMSRFYASRGVTGFVPTTMTAPVDEIIKAVENIRGAVEKGTPGAAILGINLEGPFLNRKFKGAHPEGYIINPSIELMELLMEKSGGNVRLITIAPELDGAEEFVKCFKDRGITFAVGHSSLNYLDALKAFDKGFTHTTHLFNAMTGIHHREPGLTGAALEDERVTVELIADGIHIKPTVLKMAVKCKPAEKITLVSDSTMATGLIEGEYDLGGQKIIVRDGAARLENGTLAGSTLTILDAVKNMVGLVKVPLEDALIMASATPAKVIHMEDRKGSLDAGKDADILLLDRELNLKMTIIGGKVVYRA